MNRELAPEWRKSSRCESSACFEVAFVGPEVWIRKSTDPAGPVLSFSQEEWESFVAGVLLGEFRA